MSCQFSGRALRGSTIYVFSTPNAFTFRITVPMFLISLGCSITAAILFYLISSLSGCTKTEFTSPKSYVAFVAICEAPQKMRNFLGLSATFCYALFCF